LISQATIAKYFGSEVISTPLGKYSRARKVYVGMMEFGVKVRDDDFGTWAAAEFIDLISVIAELEMSVPVRVAQAGRDYGYSYRNRWSQPVEAIELARRSVKTSAGVR
jgi:hypothetical protein